jgi:chromosome segregation ATPase
LGFVGTLAPHKGLDVLLAALEGQSGFALRVFGTTDDPQRLDELRARIERVGGQLVGPYEPSAVAEAFSSFAVLVMPSRWPEVAPFVLLEARAARRAIVASAVGGVSELVVDGREALLVPPSDALALRAALLRLRDEPQLVTQLASRCEAPDSIQHEARACLERIVRLQVERAQSPSTRTLPSTVSAVGARIAKLQSLSDDDLAARAAESLAKARKQLLGTERAPLAIVQTALARVQHERARTAELQHLLEHSTATVSSELEVLRTELAWRAGTEAALRTELSALKAEARWRAETAQHAQQVQADLQVQLGDAQRQLEQAQRQLEQAQRQLEQTQRQQVQTQQQLEQVHAHCAALATEHELAATHLAQAAQAVTELQAESAWRRAREHAQEEALQHSQARTAESERAVLAERHAHQRTREHLQRAKDSLASLRGEVEWRTAEMEAVRESLSRVRFAFVGRKLRHWVLQWPQAGEHA